MQGILVQNCWFLQGLGSFTGCQGISDAFMLIYCFGRHRQCYVCSYNADFFLSSFIAMARKISLGFRLDVACNLLCCIVQCLACNPCMMLPLHRTMDTLSSLHFVVISLIFDLVALYNPLLTEKPLNTKGMSNGNSNQPDDNQYTSTGMYCVLYCPLLL